MLLSDKAGYSSNGYCAGGKEYVVLYRKNHKAMKINVCANKFSKDEKILPG